MKFLKYLAGLVIILIIALAAVIFTIDTDQIKNQVVDLISDQTGREFRVDGNINIVPSLTPTVALNQVSLANASWGSKSKMVNVDKFEVKMDLMPLLQGNISIAKVVLNKPEILLETNKSGNPNWIFGASKKTNTTKEESGATPSSLGFNFNEVVIKDALILYKDGVNNKQNELSLESIRIQSEGMDAPLNISVNAKLNKAPIVLDSTIGSINGLLADNETLVKLNGNIDKAKVSVDGSIKKPLQAKGLNLPFEFSVDKLSSLNQIASSELPDQGPIKIKGTLQDSNGGYSVKSMITTLLTYQLNGDVTIKTSGARPYLKANLTTDTLDISSLTESDTEAKAQAKAEKVFSSEPLPLEGLKTADADISLTANKLITSSLALDKAKLNLSLNNGALKIAPFQGNTAGGQINTQLSLNASDGKTANLDLELNLKQVELGLLPQIKEQDLLQGGKTDATIKLKGKGSSVADIAGSLNGSIQIITGEGKLSNTTVNLAGADLIYSTLNTINPLSKKEEYTQMECGVIKFKIQDGMAQSEEGIALQTARMNVLGSGVINLKSEELDMGIRPKARDGVGAGLGKLVSMVRVGGTLAQPSPKVDKKGVLKAGATIGAAVATGGLSMLAEGLLDKASGDENPCDIALGKVSKTKAAKQEAPKEQKNAVDSVKEKTEQATDKVKGLLKGLF